MGKTNYLADIWSATKFEDAELCDYATAQLHRDTRVGLQMLAGLSLVMQMGVTVLALTRGLGPAYLYSSLVFGLLSLHIVISATFITEVRSLHALGVAFLIIGALTITLLAHRSNDLNIGMMAAVVMLFIAVPLVPWALREVTIVVGLTYVLLMLSLSSVPGRFDSGALMVLQVLVLGAAIIVIILTGRNTFIRKQDLRARFELQKAHNAMRLVSMQDHLTGAWNRRFLDEHFATFAAACLARGKSVYIAVLDIDDFKGINDRFGHQAGDEILVAVARTFMRLLEERDAGRLVRLGGDEFLIAYSGDDLDQLIYDAIVELQSGSINDLLDDDTRISISAGIARAKPIELADLDALYRNADKALYQQKRNANFAGKLADAKVFTGTWQI